VLWIDATDLVEFLASGSTVSGVQRVQAKVIPRLIATIPNTDPNTKLVVMDRSRGVFVEVDQAVLDGGQTLAQECLQRISGSAPVNFAGEQDVLLALGAVWINDQLMAAIRQATSLGVRFVDLFYDMTPVLDAGHAPELRPLFERYLALLSDCAIRVPAISQSSRRDLETYATDRGWRVPAGEATGLPSGLIAGESTPPDFDYALMVGTIEARKNHLLAFQIWQELMRKHGKESIPKLVCVGKIGWNSDEFLKALEETNNLDGAIELRIDQVSDSELAQLYQGATFTIYPSSYEGWGLPVSESLYFGTPVVAANNSSLPEAGGDLASYAHTGDLQDFVSVIERDMLNETRREEIRQRIKATDLTQVTWESVTGVFVAEVEAARTTPFPSPDIPHLSEWVSYPLGAPHTDFTDRLIIGNQRPPQPWGIPLFRNQVVSIRAHDDVAGAVTVHLGTLCEAGVVTLEINGVAHTFSRGEFVSVTVDGQRDINLKITAVDVGPSDKGFIGLTSIMIEGESAMASEELTDFAIKKLQAENEALRADIAQLTSELTDARAELERKSQGLLSRASRKLNRPVKD
jgi:glycosyltransferase involved in cell wall biosynthesis